MRPHYVVKGYPYVYRTGAPGVADTDFPLEYIWIDVSTDTAYMLNSITNGLASWAVKLPDTVINSGVGEMRIIGESYMGEAVRIPGGGWSLPPNVVTSTPGGWRSSGHRYLC